MFLGGDQFNGEDGGLSLWEMPESVRDRKIEWVHLSPEQTEREFKPAKKISHEDRACCF